MEAVSGKTEIPLVKVLDGGMGDEIHKRLGSGEKEWSAPGLLVEANHELVYNLHLEFAEAGAQFLTTANFSVREFNGYNLDQVKRACSAAGQLARRAADTIFEREKRKIHVLGCLPPLNDCFRKDAAEKTAQNPKALEEYTAMIGSLLPNVDGFIVETLSSTAEAIVALNALQGLVGGRDLIIWVSFSPNREGHLYSGESFNDAVNMLGTFKAKFGFPHAVLLNCSAPECIERALTTLDRSRDLPFELGVYPNRYFPVPEDWESLEQPLRTELTPEKLAEFAVKCRDNFRISIVGGCCGIPAGHIKALSTALFPSST